MKKRREEHRYQMHQQLQMQMMMLMNPSRVHAPAPTSPLTQNSVHSSPAARDRKRGKREVRD